MTIALKKLYGLKEKWNEELEKLDKIRKLIKQIDDIRFLIAEAEHERVADQYEKEVENMYTHPTDRDSTEYGEVPQYAEKGSMRPGYYYYPLRNRY